MSCQSKGICKFLTVYFMENKWKLLVLLKLFCRVGRMFVLDGSTGRICSREIDIIVYRMAAMLHTQSLSLCLSLVIYINTHISVQYVVHNKHEKRQRELEGGRGSRSAHFISFLDECTALSWMKLGTFSPGRPTGGSKRGERRKEEREKKRGREGQRCLLPAGCVGWLSK